MKIFFMRTVSSLTSLFFYDTVKVNNFICEERELGVSQAERAENSAADR
jgi:hypothetical protein